MKFRLALLLPLVLAAPAGAQYAGPAILSRGEAPAAMNAPEISFRPYIEASMIYDTGLAGVAVNAQGQVLNQASYGEALTWGISGTHTWRHTSLGLEYHGTLTHYDNLGGYDHIDQSLLLGVKHEFTHHLSMSLHQSAGIATLNFGPLGLRQTVPFDPSTTDVPVTDYFDNRTIYLTTGISLIYQRTARLSFAFGGNGSFIRRHSKALYGTNGLSAHGDVQYRATRGTTIGAQYTYMNYSYPGLSGGTDAHAVAGTYSLRVNRRLEFSGYAGIVRVESKFVQTVAVDPVIAAILGISGAPEVTHNTFIAPHAAGRLSRTFHNGVVYVSGGHSIYPGNGLFVTSTLTNAMGGYSYTGLRRWSFGASASYGRANSLGVVTGGYIDSGESLLMSREIRHGFHFVTSISARQYRSPDYQNYNRNFTEGRVAIGYSPGDVPLRVW